MVVAKLHIICGNCGSNENWDYAEFDPKGIDATIGSEPVYLPEITIRCECGTLHGLSDYMTIQEVDNDN